MNKQVYRVVPLDLQQLWENQIVSQIIGQKFLTANTVLYYLQSFKSKKKEATVKVRDVFCLLLMLRVLRLEKEQGKQASYISAWIQTSDNIIKK